MPRLFVAIELPPALIETLDSYIPRRLPGARPLRPQQMHLTLHFLGEQQAVDEIRAALATVQHPAFTLHPRGLGAFPPQGRARVAWAGLEPSPALNELHAALGQALLATGHYTPEARPFSPHLTLARFDPPIARAALADWLAQGLAFSAPPFAVQRFVLMRSTLRPEGALYSVEAAFALG